MEHSAKDKIKEGIQEIQNTIQEWQENLRIEELEETLGDKAEKAIGDVITHTPLDTPVLEVRPGQGQVRPGQGQVLSGQGQVRSGQGQAVPQMQAPQWYSVPVPEMKAFQWYRVPVPEGITADGSEYHIYVRKGTTDHLCVFLSGGGIAWNPYTAAHPVTGGRVLAWLPNYYWSNLRPFTQIYNIGVGITENNERRNPFYDWNFVIVTYATGDLHIGRSRYPYTDEQGQEQILHFHGYENFLSSMRIGKTLLPRADKLLIAGESAGAFAVPALAEQIHQEFYPMCRDVTLLSDSALLVKKGWKKVAREVWGARKEIFRDLHGTNMTLDWYRALYARQGDQYRYLYASSVRDYLLSAFYNDVQNKEYDTDEKMQRIFERQQRSMVRALKKVTPAFGVFLYDWKRPLLYRGGTIHTMIRQPEFYMHQHGNPSMAQWLYAAVNGEVTDVGLDLAGLSGDLS